MFFLSKKFTYKQIWFDLSIDNRYRLTPPIPQLKNKLYLLFLFIIPSTLTFPLYLTFNLTHLNNNNLKEIKIKLSKIL